MSVPAGNPPHLPLAVDANGELHDTATIELAPESLTTPLRCADCGTFLEAVRAHPRREDASIIQVTAHYRLAPGATHAPTCHWNIEQKPRSAPGSYVAGPRHSGPRVYCLVVPERGSRAGAKWRGRRHRAPKRPVINSADDVAAVLRQADDLSLVWLDYRGRAVRWHDFCIDAGDVCLLQHFEQNQRPHPVAVVGCVGDAVSESRGRLYRAPLFGSVQAESATSGGVRLSLLSRQPSLLGCNRSSEIVVLGWLRPEPRRLDSTHRHLGLWIDRRWQVASRSL